MIEAIVLTDNFTKCEDIIFSDIVDSREIVPREWEKEGGLHEGSIGKFL
jgi:hypothetical protein